MSRTRSAKSLSKITSGVAEGLRQATKATTSPSSSSDVNAISIHAVMCARRVIFSRPYLTADEMHELSHRLSLLGTNGAINCVLLAPDTEVEWHHVDDAEYNAYNVGGLRLPSTVNTSTEKRFSAGNYNVFDARFQNPYHVKDCYFGFYHTLSHSFNNTSSNNKQQLQREQVAYLLDGFSSLTRTTNRMAKAPILTAIPGKVYDGGYALCMGRYVLATPHSSYQIQNLSKGLALDPCGLSYSLPRFSRDYNPPDSDLAQLSLAMGKLVALAKYEMNALDLIQTGMATHYMEHWEASTLDSLERSLGCIPSYQAQVKREERAWKRRMDVETGGGRRNKNQNTPWGRRYQEQQDSTMFASSAYAAAMRGGTHVPSLSGGQNETTAYTHGSTLDAAIANTLDAHSLCHTFYPNLLMSDLPPQEDDKDPELALDRIVDEEGVVKYRSKQTGEMVWMNKRRHVSELASYAATFYEILMRDSVEGIMEGLREARDAAKASLVSSSSAFPSDCRREEVQEYHDVAEGLLQGMEGQSPLALAVTHGLLVRGADARATLESCLRRERRVMVELVCRGKDFGRWREVEGKTKKGKGKGKGGKVKWMHKSVAEVSQQELDDLFGDS